MATINCLVSNILQNILFCVQQKKETHTSVGWVNDDRIVISGWTIDLTSPAALELPPVMYQYHWS